MPPILPLPGKKNANCSALDYGVKMIRTDWPVYNGTMKHWLLGLAGLLLVCTQALAQEKVPVSAALDASALQPGKPARLAVVLDIPKGFHAQSHAPLADNLIATDVKLDAQPGLTFGPAVFPAAHILHYEALGGDVSVYSGKTIIVVPVTVAADRVVGPVEIAGSVRFQVCDDKTCFKPENVKFKISTSVVAPSETVTPANKDLFNSIVQPINGGITGVSSNGSTTAQTNGPATFSLLGVSGTISTIWGALLAAFFAGLIFNVMPCVLPVLPLKAIGFYEVSQHHRGRTLMLGTAFSIGLIGVFALLGFGVIVSKQVFHTQFSWGQWFSVPWIVWGIGAVLVVLGAWLLGAFSALQLPTGIYGLNFRHDTLGGNLQWGALTAVLSTPCTAPLLPVVIAFALVQSLSVAFATILMVGIGMASPYFVLSAFPGIARRFPRTGPLSELVKQMTAFLLFGSAAFFVGATFRQAGVQGWLVFAVALSASVYLIFRTRTLYKGSPRAVGIAALLAVLVSGTSLWAAWPEKTEGKLPWVEYSRQAFDQARAQHRPVLIKFTAKWCLNCLAMEKTVYRDARVLEAIKKGGVAPMKLDVDHEGWDLLNALSPGAGIPFTAVYPPDQDNPLILASVHDTQALLDVLNQATGHAVATVGEK